MKKCWFVAGRRRKRKEERERVKRERKSLVLRTWCRHVPNAGPTKMHVFTILPRYSFFKNWKQLKVVFNFRDSISFFWELSYENWVWKLIQTKQLAVGSTKFRNWGLVWFKKNDHSVFIIHHPSLSFHHSSSITHHSKLYFFTHSK